MVTAEVGRAIANWKIEEVERLKDLIKDYKCVCLVSFKNLPAPNFQEIRRDERLMIKVSRSTLIKRALSGLGMGEISDLAYEERALVLSNEDAFSLFSIIEEKKYPMPARSGQISDRDIKIVKGETPLRPGPVLSELQKAGIPAAIEGGKVVIRETKTLIKAGETVSSEVAGALSKLEIFPFEASLQVKAIFEDGTLFKPEDLEIDYDRRKEDIARAYNVAIDLAMAAGLFTEETAEIFISKSYRNAVSVALEVGYVTPETSLIMLNMANAMARALNVVVSEGREETKAEKKDETGEEDIASGLGALFG